MNILIACKNIKTPSGKSKLDVQKTPRNDFMPSQGLKFLDAFIDHAQDPTSSISGVSTMDVIPVVITPLIVKCPVCFGQDDDLNVLTLEPHAKFIKSLHGHLTCIPVKASEISLVLVVSIASLLF